MSSSTVETSTWGQKGKKTEFFDDSEIDPEVLLEEAEFHWGGDYLEVEEGAQNLQSGDERKTYNVYVGRNDETTLSFKYMFDSPRYNCNKNVEDLWEIYVEPVVEKARK